jgi:polysaccharide biosynthesis transport protein
MNIKQFFAILKAHWLIAVIVTLLVTAGTAIANLVMPKIYNAQAVVLLDNRSADPVAGTQLASIVINGSYLATQSDVITSDRVSGLVIRDMKLGENVELRKEWVEQTKGQGDFDVWLGNKLRRGLEVKPSNTSATLTVAYSAADPKFAASMANAFVKSYVETSLAMRVDPTKRYNSFFEEQSKTMRDKLEEAQAKLSKYQRDNGILATDERVDIEVQRLNELNAQLTTMQAMAAEAQSRSNQASARSDVSQDVINNPAVQSLRAELGQKEAKLEELSSRLGDAHPQVAELRVSITQTRQRLATETRRVTSSVGVNNTISRSREVEVRASLDQQRQKVLRLREQRDEVSRIQKEVEAAQRTYDAVVMRLSQTNLESQNTQTNISVLSPATVPPDPIFPKVGPNTLKGLMVGLALGIAAALALEFLDKRVRTVEDLAANLDIPVMGAMPRPMPGNWLGTSKGPQLQLPNNVVARLPRG